MTRVHRASVVMFVLWMSGWLLSAANWEGSGVLGPACNGAMDYFSMAECKNEQTPVWIASDYKYYAFMIVGVPLLIYGMAEAIRWVMRGEK